MNIHVFNLGDVLLDFHGEGLRQNTHRLHDSPQRRDRKYHIKHNVSDGDFHINHNVSDGRPPIINNDMIGNLT